MARTARPRGAGLVRVGVAVLTVVVAESVLDDTVATGQGAFIVATLTSEWTMFARQHEPGL